MSRNYPAGKNPFFSDEDDSVGFGSGRAASGGYRDISDDEFAKPVPTKAQQLQQMKEESMNRQLESAQRALSSIYDSERMGVATAEELLHQGEQLDNIEAKTAAINADMKTSQRHLNSIKSVFGGIKNWWSGGKKQEAEQASTTTTNQRQSRLRDTMDSRRENETEHPAMRLHSEDVSGFYETDSDYPQQKQVSSGMKAYDEQFNKNLDMMSDGMSRLKGLALGLGDEIEAQNDQIDRINREVDKADISIQDKNKQMRQILGIKKK